MRASGKERIDEGGGSSTKYTENDMKTAQDGLKNLEIALRIPRDGLKTAQIGLEAAAKLLHDGPKVPSRCRNTSWKRGRGCSEEKQSRQSGENGDMKENLKINGR